MRQYPVINNDFLLRLQIGYFRIKKSFMVIYECCFKNWLVKYEEEKNLF